MSFNPDLCKQALEIIFIRKTMKISHPLLHFKIALSQNPHMKNTLG